MSGAGKQEWGSVVTQVLNVFQSNCGSDASRTLPGSCVTGGGVTKSALHGSVGTLQFSPSGFFFLITQNAKRSSFVDMCNTEYESELNGEVQLKSVTS